MSSPASSRRSALPPVDPATMRRLMLHEARVHATPSRRIRDLGDAILLDDPADPEPFWNRLEACRWPDESAAFDRRLTEALLLFTALGREPHIWATPLHDSPVDLVARLQSNGFRDMGKGDLMALADPTRARSVVAGPRAPGVTIERLSGLDLRHAGEVAPPIVGVLLDAFEVEEERRPGIEAETAVSLGHPWFTHYLARIDGEPAAVARRATFEGASYLSSIGTASWARGRGLGRLVSAAAVADAVDAASEWTYLGVFADNDVAIRLYRALGFERVGESSPDLILL